MATNKTRIKQSTKSAGGSHKIKQVPPIDPKSQAKQSSLAIDERIESANDDDDDSTIEGKEVSAKPSPQRFVMPDPNRYQGIKEIKSQDLVAFWRPVMEVTEQVTRNGKLVKEKRIVPDEAVGWLGQWWECGFELTQEIFDSAPNQLKRFAICGLKGWDSMFGRDYNTAEKFMMMAKAAFFGDKYVFEKMAASDNPKTMKSLGRKVKDFNEAKWKEWSPQIVIFGNWLKFTQNPNLCDRLLATGEKRLIEASPLDKIWGIGFEPTHRNVNYPPTWNGATNLLGQSLEYVRDLLRE